MYYNAKFISFCHNHHYFLKRAYMKVLLINQNPVIKKLVGMASKKLNLEVENVARIANDFRPKDYICIIVDDENVGKNLERLTALQDQVKVCLLFARKTQIKKHEFNIAIQKPFLPTDILEILNDCIPKEGEIKEADDEISNEGLEEYDNVKSINEIDMDLKSAEITPPDGINIDTAKLQAEAEEIAGEDTDSMLDFNPDSLDFSDLQAAGEVTSEEEVADSTDDENTEKENNTTDKEDSIKESEEEPEHRVGSIFDSDLSDLKPSSDNPLDLANFDLDSIVDSSALKAASLGIPAQIEEEAKEAADSLGDDEDDLFLSDDERDLLQPSPKKFMQAKKEEEELKAKEQENNADDTADTQSLENESLDDILDDESLKNVSDDSSTKDIEADADTESANSDLDNIDLESLALQSDITQEKDDSIESRADITETSTDNLTAIDKKELDDMGLMDMDLDTQAPKSTPKPSVEHDIDSIDLSGLDETLSKQATQDTTTTNTLDDAFDELSAALNSAFDNMILSGESSDETNDSKIEHDSNLQDLENIDSTTQTKDLDSKETENINLDDLDLQIDETINEATNTDNSTESSLDSNPKEINNLAQDESLESLIDDSSELLESKAQDSENMDSNDCHVEQSETSKNLESKEADDLLLDSLDLDSMDITHDIESQSLDTENKEDDINSLLQLDDELNLQSQESKEVETNDTQQLDNDLLDGLDSNDSPVSTPDLESNTLDDLNGDLDKDLSIEIDDTKAPDSNQIDMDLEAMLNIDEELGTQNPDSKPQVLQEDTLAEVNEALEALNDEVALNDNTDLSQADDIKDELLDSENKDSMDLDNADDLLTDFLSDSDSSELDLQKDLIDGETHTQNGIDTDSNMLDDMLAELDSKSSTDTLESSDITSNDNSTKSLETNPDTLYVALPSNEEALENLTETELAEALGEITDLDIVRIDPNDINPNQLNQNKLDETRDTPAINTESSITDTQEIESNLNETQLDDAMPLNNEAPLDTLSTTDTINKDNVKELDANSLIDFFKNTPKEKLHEILDGSEINFSIHFGKDK